MDRRTALAGAFALAFAPQVPARETPRLGIMFTRARMSPDMQAFLTELRRLGYEDGQTIRIDYLDGQPGRAPEMARELVQRKADIIFAPNTALAVAARGATTSIPVIFATAHDPVHVGLVQSLAKPGTNVTGVTSFATELPAKRLQLFKELMPSLQRIAVLRSPLNPQTMPAWDTLVSAARTVGVSLQAFDMAGGADLPSAFQAMKGAGLQAMFIQDDAATSVHWKQIGALSVEHRIASNSTWDEATQAGVLFSYGPSLVDNYVRAASFVDMVLKGARPANLPVEQPTKFKLALNVRTAKAIGLAVPEGFRLYVDNIVES